MTNAEIISDYKSAHGITGELHTFRKWKELGRPVKRGEKSQHRIQIWNGNRMADTCFFLENQVEPISIPQPATPITPHVEITPPKTDSVKPTLRGSYAEVSLSQAMDIINRGRPRGCYIAKAGEQYMAINTENGKVTVEDFDDEVEAISWLIF